MKPLHLFYNTNSAGKRKMFFFFSMLLNLCVIAQPEAKTEWICKQPFDQRIFIENKGQCITSYEKLNGKDILFHSYFEGLHYYFTKNAIWIKRIATVRRSKREQREMEKRLKKITSEENEEEIEEEGKMRKWKQKELFYCMEFVGSSEETAVEGFEQVTQRFNFKATVQATITASAYDKIVYHNLYKGIDMEIIYPDGKSGFKYNLLLQPGADPEQINIHYPFSKSTQLKNGDLITKSLLGTFTEKAPLAMQGSSPVNCFFQLKDGLAGFKIKGYDPAQPLRIDPWTIAPGFTDEQIVMDLDWDDAGNCYIMGGCSVWQGITELIKFDSNGNKLWSYMVQDFGMFFLHGDFAVDRQTQSCYLVSGFMDYDTLRLGAEIVKLDARGIKTAEFQVDTMLLEMWRIKFNSCTKQIVIGGGGTLQASHHGCTADTNLLNVKTVHILNTQECCHDVCGLALDNSGNCYMLFSEGVSVQNELVKVPVVGLSPMKWIKESNYRFMETASIVYYFGTNGYNGMCVSDNKLYTYDGYSLKTWDTANGDLLDSTSVNTAANTSRIVYGGLASDDCENIFLATDDHVQYRKKGTINPVSIFFAPGNIYDMELGRNNILYAGGKGFVAAVKVDLLECKPLLATKKITPASCGKKGSATIFISGGTPSYTFSWNTVPVQTGNTATDLSPGTYIVTIKDASCPQRIKMDTIVITGSADLTLTTTAIPAACNGGQGMVSVSVKGGVSPYTYLWKPGGAVASSIDKLKVGMYYVTVIGADGCKGSDSILLTEPSPIQLTTTSEDEICGNASGSAQVTVSGGTAPYTYLWSTGSTSSSLKNLKSGTYNITVQDKNACKKSSSIVVKNNSYGPKAEFTCNPSITDLFAPEIKFTDNSNGAQKWYWSFGDGGTDSVQNPIHVYQESGSFTVTLQIINMYGCMSSATGTVIIRPLWSFYIPSSFTPDGDGLNDTFNGKGEGLQGYKMMVFNRWGEEIFETNSLLVSWDGKANHGNETAQQDVYLYLVVLKDSKGVEHRYTGTVTLVK
jgi:gliding motility-associated-like protein